MDYDWTDIAAIVIGVIAFFGFILLMGIFYFSTEEQAAKLCYEYGYGSNCRITKSDLEKRNETI